MSSDGEDMVESDEEENDEEVVLNDEVSLSCSFTATQGFWLSEAKRPSSCFAG